MKKDSKQRVTAFIDPVLVKRVKVRAALEELTISEVIEKAIDTYTPKIENDGDKRIHLKFISAPAMRILIPKHTK